MTILEKEKTEKYERALEYNIYEAIKIRAEEILETKITPRKGQRNNFSFPEDISNNPLLTDKKWLAENVEYFFVYSPFSYQRCQGPNEYYMLFKTLIEKYNMDDDYNKLLEDPDRNHLLKCKWTDFAYNLIGFCGYARDEVLDNLLNQDDFIAYLLKYPQVYTHRTLEKFGYVGISRLLKEDSFSSYYLDDPEKFIRLMEENVKLRVPLNIFFDERLKKLSYDINVESFYSKMDLIWEKNSGIMLLEEHKRFCDHEISHLDNGILPNLMKEYELAPEYITEDYFEYCDNPLKNQTVGRIFHRLEQEEIPKQKFYQELSKYITVGLLMSERFETSPYNLLIDIKTLFSFAKENNRELEGDFVYDFLINFENFDITYIKNFYQKVKNLPLKEILYDDWMRQKNILIDEINRNTLQLEDLPSQKTEYNVPYYDISNLENPILVHNTGIPVQSQFLISELIDHSKKGKIHHICLSLQDQKHQTFYNSDSKNTIKLVYGPLDPNRVGIINHEDAYSVGLTEVEYTNVQYIRRLYTLKQFMELTYKYNEIVYFIGGVPMIPLGVLCEGTPTNGEIRVVEELGIAIFYRSGNDLLKRDEENPKQLHLAQKYQWQIDAMRLFPKAKE